MRLSFSEYYARDTGCEFCLPERVTLKESLEDGKTYDLKFDKMGQVSAVKGSHVYTLHDTA